MRRHRHGLPLLGGRGVGETVVEPDVRHLEAIARAYVRQCWESGGPVDLGPWFSAVPEGWHKALAMHLLPPWIHFSWASGGERAVYRELQAGGFSRFAENPVIGLHFRICGLGFSGGGGHRAAFRFGRYLIRYLLGAGSHGVVYRCWDPVLQRDVAVKLVAAKGQHTEGVLREARTLAALPAGPWPGVHDAGRRRELLWLARDFVRGRLLGGLLAQGCTSARGLLQVALRVACSVSRLHRTGVVHCDLSPSNVLVQKDGTVILVDFCCSARAGERRQITGSSPPELVAAEAKDTAGVVDPRWDVHAIGALLRGALDDVAGKGSRGHLMVQDSAGHGDVADLLEKVSERACSADPGQRYPTAGAMVRALRKGLDDRRSRVAVRTEGES